MRICIDPVLKKKKKKAGFGDRKGKREGFPDWINNVNSFNLP